MGIGIPSSQRRIGITRNLRSKAAAAFSVATGALNSRQPHKTARRAESTKMSVGLGGRRAVARWGKDEQRPLWTVRVVPRLYGPALTVATRRSALCREGANGA